MTQHEIVCTACGHKAVPDDAKFCPNCGQHVSGSVASTVCHTVPMVAAVPVVEARQVSSAPGNLSPSAPPQTVDPAATEESQISYATASVPLAPSALPGPAQQADMAASASAPSPPISGDTRKHSGATTEMEMAIYWKKPSPAMLKAAAKTQFSGGILSATCMCENQGKFTVPRTLHVGNILNSTKLDFSMADFVHPITTIQVGTILGACIVTVPCGVRVETRGVGILGEFRGLDSQTIHAGQDGPLIIIRGFAVLGAANVIINNDVPPVQIVE